MLSPPPRDAVGSVTPHDHPEILTEDCVIRRISPQFVVPDGSGGKRLSSMAFKPSSKALGGGLSVDLQRQIEEAGLNAIEYVSNPPWIGAVKFIVGPLRTNGFMVGYDPLIPDNPYHGEVWGDFTRNKIKILFGMAQWIVQIPDVAIEP